MTNIDIGKSVQTPDGEGVYLGSAEITSPTPDGTFATVLINGRRLVYEVSAVTIAYPERPVTHFENIPDAPEISEWKDERNSRPFPY